MGHEWREDVLPDVSVCGRCGAVDDDEFPEDTPRDCNAVDSGTEAR